MFPAAVLSQTADFAFALEPELDAALHRLHRESDVALLLLDADSESLPQVLSFLHEARRLRPRLPIIAFSDRGGDAMRYLLRDGATWHFTKRSRSIAHLARALRRHAPLISESEVWLLPATRSAAGEVPEEPLRNPYIVGRPLTGPSASLFIGRNEVFAWIGENLSGTARPNPLLLYGERRIGKTSTLYQLVEGERGRDLREDRARPLFPAYIDLQRLAGCRTDEWLRGLARDIYRQVAVRGLSRAVPDSRAGSDSAYAALDRALDYLEQNLPDEATILLAVDELEQLRAGIAAGLLDEAIAPWLRSQVQHRSRLAFIFSGSYGLLDEFWRPILDLTARYELGPLSAAETETLIRQPVNSRLTYDDAAVERIWHNTGGRPFRIQLLCHRLVSGRYRQKRRESIGVADVEQVISELEREPDSMWATIAPPGGLAAT